jgi:hypothetical protein
VLLPFLLALALCAGAAFYPFNKAIIGGREFDQSFGKYPLESQVLPPSTRNWKRMFNAGAGSLVVGGVILPIPDTPYKYQVFKCLPLMIFPSLLDTPVVGIVATGSHRVSVLSLLVG